MKVGSFLFAFLLFSGILIQIDIEPINVAADEVDLIEYIDNVTIQTGERILWENETVLIEGGIVNGGELSIKDSTVTIDSPPPMWGLENNGLVNIVNSTLTFKFRGLNNNHVINIFNSTVDFTVFGIYNNGSFNMTDNDGDTSTNSDASELIMRRGYSNNFYNVQNTGSIVNINRSYVERVSFFRGFIDIHDLEMRNCTIKDPIGFSMLYDLNMLGNGTKIAIDSNLYSISLDDVSISNYDVGLFIKSYSDHRNLTIKECRYGILTHYGDPRIKGSKLIDNTVQIQSYSNITLQDVEIFNGSVDFHTLSTIILQKCYFSGVDSIKNISNGVVRDSIFLNCGIAIEDALKTRFLENRFVENGIAVLNSQDCSFYHNSFINNMRIVSGPPLSTWYNETLKEGNFYDTYTGSDDGSSDRRANDGVGDTLIPYLSRDQYPLIQDQYWKMPAIPDIDGQYDVGSDIVRLNWEQKGTHFILQRSTDPDFSTHLVSWSETEPGLVIKDNPNSTLYFRVRGYNSIGSRGWSESISILVNQKPLPPHNIKVEPVPEGEALLVTWDWQGEDVDRGMIFIRRGGIDLNPKLVDHTENAFIIRDLENFIPYSIRMIAVDLSGLSSDLSEPVSATPIDQIPPPPPRNLKALTKGNESIALEWYPPLTQDLWGYIVYRRDPGEEEFVEITRFSKGVLYYEDQGLRDNTTYEYALASVDDDGPISGLSEIAKNTTLHFNHRPVFSGSELILYLIEDEGPLQSNILSNFTDQDGDELIFSVIEYFPFRTTISGNILWVIPEIDQAGEGYVQISVSDGEESVPYLIGIIVEPVDDPPRGIQIIYPINGSVLLPGAPVSLEASGSDPDSDQGDILNVTWSSDVEGLLHISTQSNLRAVVELSSGVHVLELRVEDRTGNIVVDQVTVVVSLWGWGDIPWNSEFSLTSDKVNVDSPYIVLDLSNDSPLVLSFSINGNAGSTSIGERNILVGPRSEGSITIQLPYELTPGEDLEVTLMIETQTLNGTYGGTQEISHTFSIVRSNGSNGDSNAAIAVIIIISIFALLSVGGYILYIYRFKNRSGPQR